ncbi:MAG: hypothetical protein ACI4RN_06895 [Oscillospiraceae bacterium]
MKLMVIILNKVDSLEYLLEGLSTVGICGATVIESSGMARILSKVDDSFINSSLKAFFSDDEDNRTILSVIKNDQLDIARRVIYNTIGDLSLPNTGIMFTMPIDFAEGLTKNSLISSAKKSDSAEEEKK